MKTSTKAIALILTLAALTASSFGNTVTLGPDSGSYRVGSGGEFNWIPQAGDPDGLLANYISGVNGTAVGSGFESFCIQVGEHIGFGGTYEYAISTSAKGPTGTDEISKGTAWLYSQFATKTLGGYVYTPGAARAQSAGMLQNAIWYLENEISLSAADISSNIFLTGGNGALTFFGSEANARQDAFGLYGVYALNLGQAGATNQTWSNQDQLIYRGHSVADGATTLMLLGLATIAIFVIQYRIRKT